MRDKTMMTGRECVRTEAEGKIYFTFSSKYHVWVKNAREGEYGWVGYADER